MSTPVAGAESWAGPDLDPDRYRLGRLAGAGSEGLLYHGSLTTDSGVVLDVAIKMLHPRFAHRVETLGRRWTEQLELFRSLRVDGMVAVRDVFTGPLPHAAGEIDVGGAKSLYLVMNWVDGETLEEWADRHQGMAPADRLRLLLPVAAALDLAHSGVATGGVPVVHCDIKPANILVTSEGDATLVDPGLTRALPGGSRGSSVTGTLGYLAPEVLAEGRYSPASDGYALGMVAWWLLTGCDPPEGNDLRRLEAEMVAAHPGQPVLVSHVLAMLAADPAARPSLLANWVAQLRQSSLGDDLPFAGKVPTAPSASEPTTPVADIGGAAYDGIPALLTNRRKRLVGLIVVLAACIVGSAALLAATSDHHHVPAQLSTSATSTFLVPTTQSSGSESTVVSTTIASTTTSTVSPTTPAVACVNSYNPSCGPFHWSSALNNKPLMIVWSYSPVHPVAGQPVTFRIAITDPDEGTNLRVTGTYFDDIGVGGPQPGSVACQDLRTGAWTPPAPGPPGHVEVELTHTFTASGTYHVHFDAASGLPPAGTDQCQLQDPYASSGTSKIIDVVIFAPPISSTTAVALTTGPATTLTR